MTLVRSVLALAIHRFGELVAPLGCAACDEHVERSSLFCVPCAASVLRSADEGAAFDYGGALATAVRRLKYSNRADLGPRLGQGLLSAATCFAGRVDAIVPVPLHPRRLAERGYNQAALLASPVARSLGVTFAPRALVRVRDTPRQAALKDRARRYDNVAGGFAVHDGAVRLVRRSRILLMDDVLTTGATTSACRSALHEAGAKAVLTLVLARTSSESLIPSDESDPRTTT